MPSVTMQIKAPYFTAGLVLMNWRVVRAAPILKWMIGLSQSQVIAYCEKRGWKARTLE